MLTLNWEVSAGRSSNLFVNFTQIAPKFVITYLIENIKTSFPVGKQTLVHLHDILKKLSAKTYFDASFMCFLDLLHFVSLLTVYVVERKFVAYCHAYVYG